ncbi:structural protein [Rhodococcus phage E3]|uniref:structural protein n=1 Tax=Rhodococcus phage E3 TaxID=1007869 RepID=UPI0002C6BAF7|nr:structural protein [Rhodococcus phage E3]AEQ21022.1 structural protein [Rhodococcus phage E3]
MARIDLREDYAVQMLRRNVKESLQSHGEQCIALAMYHVVADADRFPRCTCFDDIYQSSETYDCPDCYGTTIQGGVKTAARVWGLFTDQQGIEDHDKQGVWTPDQRGLQTEASPELMEHDYIIRVLDWDRSGRALDLEGIYIVDKVDLTSLRTGGVYGQTRRDAVGQRANLTRLQDTHPIYRYPALGKLFPRLDGLVR